MDLYMKVKVKLWLPAFKNTFTKMFGQQRFFEWFPPAMIFLFTIRGTTKWNPEQNCKSKYIDQNTSKIDLPHEFKKMFLDPL